MIRAVVTCDKCHEETIEWTGQSTRDIFDFIKLHNWTVWYNKKALPNPKHLCPTCEFPYRTET